MVARPAVKNEGQKIEMIFKVIGDVPGDAGFCSGFLDIIVILVVTYIKER